MAHPALPADFDVNDPDTYAVRLPREEWAELRRTAPVWWQAQPPGRDGFGSIAGSGGLGAGFSRRRLRL